MNYYDFASGLIVGLGIGIIFVGFIAVKEVESLRKTIGKLHIELRHATRRRK